MWEESPVMGNPLAFVKWPRGNPLASSQNAGGGWRSSQRRRGLQIRSFAERVDDGVAEVETLHSLPGSRWVGRHASRAERLDCCGAKFAGLWRLHARGVRRLGEDHRIIAAGQSGWLRVHVCHHAWLRVVCVLRCPQGTRFASRPPTGTLQRPGYLPCTLSAGYLKDSDA